MPRTRGKPVGLNRYVEGPAKLLDGNTPQKRAGIAVALPQFEDQGLRNRFRSLIPAPFNLNICDRTPVSKSSSNRTSTIRRGEECMYVEPQWKEMENLSGITRWLKYSTETPMIGGLSSEAYLAITYHRETSKCGSMSARDSLLGRRRRSPQ